MLYAVILAGGKGERFWPLSRQLEPKQFLEVTHDSSLLQDTVSRISKRVPAKNIYVITNLSYSFEIYKQLSKFDIPQGNILLEPEGKNTAAAIGWAAVNLYRKDPEAVMVVLPSDHMILRENIFLQAVNQAVRLAKKNYLVTLGAMPKYPASGYGYIKIKSKIKDEKLSFLVERFTEKPDITKAEKFIRNKNYFWNCGIFIWKAGVILEEMNRYLPVLHKQLFRIDNSNLKDIWRRLPSLSVDYGILEKSKKVTMVAADMGWLDLGSWRALDEALKKDKNGNIFHADCFDIASKDTTVWAKNKLIATIGLSGLVVIDTPDALLVCKKDEAEKVKEIVNMLKIKNRQEHIAHKTVKRPWGTYTVLNSQHGFKVKLVEVEPKQSLSLQFHKKRAEHWVVVEGKAMMQHGKKTKYVYANQSIYIPAGKLHRLGNPLKTPLKIVEVQTGEYLEEDDIVRLEDAYKRV